MPEAPKTFQTKAAEWLNAQDELEEHEKEVAAAETKRMNLRNSVKTAKQALLGCVGSNIPEKAAVIEGRGVVVVFNSGHVDLIPTS